MRKQAISNSLAGAPKFYSHRMIQSCSFVIISVVIYVFGIHVLCLNQHISLFHIIVFTISVSVYRESMHWRRREDPASPEETLG